jgi:Fe-Mn family superoxide dismutase
MSNNRRDFLKKSVLLGLTGLADTIISQNNINSLQELTKNLENNPLFKLPNLPYAYDALEPFIDKQTMVIHHTKHHQSYINKLNELSIENFNINEDLAGLCKHIDNSSSLTIRNNLGGHFNHSLFWKLLKPNPQNIENIPTGKILEAIVLNFNSFEDFKKEFTEKASKVFGSGWCWLIVKEGKLKITTTPNQDNPLMKVATDNGNPILALDIWEHAYYLKYQNKRADYISNWWKIINWKQAEELFTT